MRAALFLATLVMGTMSALAESKNGNFKYGDVEANLVGQSLNSFKTYWSSTSEDKRVYDETCPDPMQVACKEKFGAYCSCSGFSVGDPEKPLLAKSYVMAVNDGKIVDMKMSSALMPVNVWNEKKDVVLPLRLSSFAKNRKPDLIYFIGSLGTHEKGGRRTSSMNVGRYVVEWKEKDGVRIAASVWCPIKSRGDLEGKLRDCFLYEASYTSIRKFVFEMDASKNIPY